MAQPPQNPAYGQQSYGQPPQAPQYGQQQQFPPPPSGAPPPSAAPPHGQQSYHPSAPSGPPPSSGAPQAAGQGDHGSFQGGSYSVTHRDTNAVLNIDLQQGGTVRSRSGAMIHMAGTIQLSGKVKFSMKKLFTGGEMAESSYAGYGRLALGPTLFGDIITLQVDPSHQWTIGKDAFLACTQQITKETKAQGFGKAMFSGEDLFIYRIGGQGVVWLTSFGAVDCLDLAQGEQHIVDNGHLVAWNCDYKIEKAGGGSMTGLKTGEGLVCRFTGPGSVYVQTRNAEEFENYVRSLAGAR